jgi:hypothetical protein
MAKKTRRRPVTSSRDAGNKTRTYVIGGFVGIGVIGLLVLLALSLRGPAEIEGVVDHGVQSRGHDNTVVYEETGLPPVGGIHADRWQRCGIYDQPVNTANAVHSLEHGIVWVTYHPDLPADEVAELQDLARGESHVLVSPFPNQSSQIALTAWGFQLSLDDAGDDRIEAFMNRYLQGPQTPEPGATCAGPNSVGTPTG